MLILKNEKSYKIIDHLFKFVISQNPEFNIKILRSKHNMIINELCYCGYLELIDYIDKTYGLTKNDFKYLNRKELVNRNKYDTPKILKFLKKHFDVDIRLGGFGYLIGYDNGCRMVV